MWEKWRQKSEEEWSAMLGNAVIEVKKWPA